MRKVALYQPYGNGYRKLQEAKTDSELGSPQGNQVMVEGHFSQLDEFISPQELKRLKMISRPE